MNDKKLIPYMEDDEFIRNKTPMTKSVIRHEIVRRLNLCSNDVVYDIGAGTGSVSIEISKLSDSLSVYAIEQKDEAIDILTQNVNKHGASNIQIVKGTAPEVLHDLPVPNAVFIGGSSGRLKDILELLHTQKNNSLSSVRVVVSAVSMETVSEILDLVNIIYVTEMHINQISVSDINEIGSYHMMQAANPVWIADFIVVSE